MVVKTIAARHGMHATFMAKPIHGENGSGMHVNQSLARGERERLPRRVRRAAAVGGVPRRYIAGVLDHLPAITSVANPTVNSYKRLLPGYEAPVYIAWSPGNRSAAIRVPAKRGRSTRIELRTPDPTANPYLALACMLEAGLDGISRGLEPAEPVNRNIYHLTEEESRGARHPQPAARPGPRARRARGRRRHARGARRAHLHRVRAAQARGVGRLQRAGAPVGDRRIHGPLLTRPGVWIGCDLPSTARQAKLASLWYNMFIGWGLPPMIAAPAPAGQRTSLTDRDSQVGSHLT